MIKPRFYDNFTCTADKCSDNCCIGWEIDIDASAMERFKKVEGAFGEKLRAAIHDGEPPTFALSAGEKCALLREDGLCELILNCGEDILCDICALHPRFFNQIGEVQEAGLGLCCEEVCRLLLSSSAPLEFICDDEDKAKIAAEPPEISFYRNIRKILTGILQDRSKPIMQRLNLCTEYSWNICENFENGGNFTLPPLPEKAKNSLSEKFFERLISTLADMESINSEWDLLLEKVTQRQAELVSGLGEFICSSKDVWIYEHIAVYWLYRHFPDSVYDGEIHARTMLAVTAAAMAMLLDFLTYLEKGEITGKDRIDNIKLYSKQVEYSAENIELFIEEYF